MNAPVPGKSDVMIGASAVVLWALASAACNQYPTVSGSGGTAGTEISTGTTGIVDTGSTGGTATGTVVPGSDTTEGSTSTWTSTSGDSDTAAWPEPYPEECYEPEAWIDVMSAMTPDGPLTIGEAWLGTDACTNHPYVTLVQYPSPETGPSVEVTLVVEPEAPVQGPWLGVYPLSLRGQLEPVGTIDVLEPLEGLGLGADPDRHLHGRIELHGDGWDLSLEVDLIDCGFGDCLCPCE